MEYIAESEYRKIYKQFPTESNINAIRFDMEKKK